MKVRFFHLGIALAASTLAGCGSNPPAPACVFPESPPTPAPAWVCDASVENVAVSAIGSYSLVGTNPGFARTQAIAAGRLELASQLRTRITGEIRNRAAMVGNGMPDASFSQVDASISEQITTETVVGSRVFLSTTSPGRRFYVLVGMDPAITAQQTTAALRASMAANPAAWQAVVGANGARQDKFAEDIAATVSNRQSQIR